MLSLDFTNVSSFGFKIGSGPDVESTLLRRIAVDTADNRLFSANVSGLEGGTTYYYMAYVTNSADSLNSDVESFITATESGAYLSVPTITYTNEIVATSTIEDDGGSDVTTAGFCWSTSPTPTILSSKVLADSIGTSFSATISQLETGETYYIRAFADNSAISGSQTIAYSSDLQYTVPTYIVDIPDAEFKSYLVANFDSNNDGDITRDEAAVVESIDIKGSTIESLEGIDAFTGLKELIVSADASNRGKLTSIDLSSNTLLESLDCSYNMLTTVNISADTLLHVLDCSGNYISTLDLSKNIALNELYCQDNLLTYLDLSSHVSLTNINCSLNSGLEKIYVWNGFDYSDSNYVKDETASFIEIGNNIPIVDANFKEYLVTNFDTDSDGEISSEEASLITSISVETDNINSVTGIEYFTNLKTLNIYGSSSSNGGLTSLDISSNTALTYLYCYSNQLTSLDVSSNTALTSFSCGDNQLSSLDVAKNTALTYLNCSSNQLTSLDVSKNTALTSLSCGYNLLSSLDISNNTALTYLWAYSYSENPLSKIYVWEGFDAAYYDFNASSYTMYVIPGDDTPTISIEDANFKAHLVSVCDANGDGEISELEASQVLAITVTTDNISTLTGIEYFTNLTSLSVNGSDSGSGGLTLLDVSSNTALTGLSCSYNQLTSLDVASNTALTYLNCYYNQLTSLDVANNTALEILYCNGNQLSSLDVVNNTALEVLYCNGNQLSSLNVASNTALTSFSCGDNQLSSLDVAKNTALTNLNCSSNQLTSLDISSNTALTTLYCSYNQLSSLDVAKNTALTYLSCGDNQLTSLDVAKNTVLIYLSCIYNQLTSLDVAKNTALTYLYCYCNQLTSLDISSNTALTTLYCSSNSDLYSIYVWNGFEESALENMSKDDQASFIVK